jgi:micrococcal nuclease
MTSAYHRHVERFMASTARGVVLMAAMLLVLADVAPARAQTSVAYVTRVVEGDLVYAELGGRIEAVRYLGVNAPFVAHPSRGPEPYATIVRERNRRLVEGRWIRLMFEREPRDEHGRLLAYVWINDLFVNAALVHWGYAEAAATGPGAGLRYADYFKGLEQGARGDARGLWRYGDVLTYYRRGGLELAGDSDYQVRAPTGAGGRVFSAPAPFIPAAVPSTSSPSGSAGSIAPPASRGVVPTVPPGTIPTPGTPYMPAPPRLR